MHMKSVAMIKRNVAGFTGAVRTFSEHVRCFHQLGYNIDIYAANVDDKMVDELGVTAYQIGFWPFVGHHGRTYFNWRVGRIINARNYDVVIGHGDVIDQDVLFLHNCRHLAYESIHGSSLPKDDAVGKIHRRMLETQNFRLLLVHSNLVKNDIRSRFNVPEDKIEVIYPGYQPETFQVNPAARERIRSRLGLRSGDILVGLITSGCNLKRNIGFFLKAAAEAAGKTDNLIKVFMLGKRATIKAHKKLAEEYGLNSAILMEPVTNVDEYYQALDVYVLPALLEEFGRVVLEAMVYGLPVAISDRVGAGEILQGVSREAIFPSGNMEMLVDKIHHLVTDAEYRHKMGEQNRTTANEYTEARQMEKLADIFARHKLIAPSNEI